MKLFLRLFLCVFLLATELSAQKVTFSPYSEFDLRGGITAVVGKLNNTLYTFRSYGAEYFLDTYNEGMEHTTTVVLDFFPKTVHKVRFVSYEKTILVLYQEQSGTRIIQYAALLSDKGILQGRPLKVQEHRTSFFGSAKDDFYFTAVSENKKHVLVYRTKLRNKQLHWEGYWLDPAQMRLVKRQKLRYKFSTPMNFEDVLLNNEGQAYLPAFNVQGSKDYASQFVLLSTNATRTSFESQPLRLKEHYIESQFLKLDETNACIHFASFYATKKNGHIDGLLSADFYWKEQHFSDLYSSTFAESLMTEADAKRSHKALDAYKIKQIIPKQGGGILVAAEEIYTSVQSSYMPGVGFYSFYYTPLMTQTIHEYHFNDILLLNLDAERRIAWHTFIRKEQYSQEDGGLFSSYTMLNTGGGLGFLFNDFNSRRSRIQLSAVSAEGQLQNGYLDAGRDDDPDWIPKMGKQVDAREIVIPCVRKKKICFAKIVL